MMTRIFLILILLTLLTSMTQELTIEDTYDSIEEGSSDKLKFSNTGEFKQIASACVAIIEMTGHYKVVDKKIYLNYDSLKTTNIIDTSYIPFNQRLDTFYIQDKKYIYRLGPYNLQNKRQKWLYKLKAK